MLYQVLGAHFRTKQKHIGLKEVRIFPAGATLDTAPLISIIPDPEDKQDSVLMLQYGAPFAEVYLYRKGYVRSLGSRREPSPCVPLLPTPASSLLAFFETPAAGTL